MQSGRWKPRQTWVHHHLQLNYSAGNQPNCPWSWSWRVSSTCKQHTHSIRFVLIIHFNITFLLKLREDIWDKIELRNAHFYLWCLQKVDFVTLKREWTQIVEITTGQKRWLTPPVLCPALLVVLMARNQLQCGYAMNPCKNGYSQICKFASLKSLVIFKVFVR